MKTVARIMIVVTASLFAALGFSQASESDKRIESAFNKSYVFQTYLHDDNIIARSKDGDVILSGKVSEASHKILAEETMVNLPGVKTVDNRLKVRGKPPSENSDKWIHMKVKTTLLFHRNVNGIKTDVSVKNGMVKLEGRAENLAQKELATEYAFDVAGVKGVDNVMTVSNKAVTPAPTVIETIDDASITAQVKVSLLYHRSTSALNTQVKTKDGIVTIHGKAANAAEKALVTKLASDINGVQSVVNEMVVSAAVSRN